MSELLTIEPVTVNAITYRQLPPAEWERLTPIFQEQDWFLPPCELATAIVGENEDGEIVHVQIYQLVLHAEPTWSREDYRGKVNYKIPWKMFKDKPRPGLVLPGFIIVAPDEKIAKLAESAGFTKIAGSLYRAEF
jgi:hypothetical protein